MQMGAIKLTNLFVLRRGVVAVSMDMMQLDINQCPDWYYEPNAYKNTHKCDEQTSYVSNHKYLTSSNNKFSSILTLLPKSLCDQPV